MKQLRIPAEVWDWKATVLVVVLLVAPPLAAVGLVPDATAASTLGAARGLLVGLAMFAAGVFLYLHWRLTASDVSGWLSVLLTVAAVPRLALAAFALGHPGTVAAQASWGLVFRVAILAALVVLARLAGRVWMPADPLALGLVVGLGISAARQGVFTRATPLPPVLHSGAVTAAAVGVMVLVLTITIARVRGVPPWVATRLAGAFLFLGLGSVIGDNVALVTGLAGAALLAATTAAHLHHAIDRDKDELASLNDRLRELEALQRHDRARLHEINSTVAGLTSASQLLDRLPARDRGQEMAVMMRGELGRLQRLLSSNDDDTGPGRARLIELDDVVGQIVTLHRARGHVVAWEPSGIRLWARADDVAEAVNILVDNAASHGSSDCISVVAELTSDGVEIRVTDVGAGVPTPLRDHVFDWGVRGPDSGGQGIGLHVAGELARGLGGELLLDDVPVGARFVLRLPSVPGEVSVRGHATPVAS